MIDRRLHAIVTATLALGLTYLGFSRYVGADRLQAPSLGASSGTEQAAAPARGQPRAGAEAPPHGGTSDTSAISAAVLRQALSVVASASEHADPSELSAGTPLAQARAILDERLAGSPPSSNEAAHLERAVRALLAPSLLGETVAELRCNATMCRVDLIGEDDARVDSAASAFAEHLPKLFSSAVTYPDGAGHRSVYLGTSAGDLKVTSGPSPSYRVVERGLESELQSPDRGGR